LKLKEIKERIDLFYNSKCAIQYFPKDVPSEKYKVRNYINKEVYADYKDIYDPEFYKINPSVLE
jgi:hypothetical protein